MGIQFTLKGKGKATSQVLPLHPKSIAMIRLVLFGLVLFGLVLTLVACSDPAPVAPHPAGKANCALCGFLGDEDYTIADGQGAHESPNNSSDKIGRASCRERV